MQPLASTCKVRSRSGCFKCQAGNLRGCHLVGLVPGVGAGGGSPPIGNTLDIFLETVYKLKEQIMFAFLWNSRTLMLEDIKNSCMFAIYRKLPTEF